MGNLTITTGMRAAGARAFAAVHEELVDREHAEEEGVRRGALLGERLAEQGTDLDALQGLCVEWWRGWNDELVKYFGP